MLLKKLKAGNILNLSETVNIKSGYVSLPAGQAVGSHITENREEVILIIKGQAEVVCNGKRVSAKKGHLVYIPKESKHNVINSGRTRLEYLYLVSMLQAS
ncbi:cupin domain-containing protein [Candidatus Parcubacteria bacterium]|nr:MAG: cupin domain-containing protein [Candidatus Parcubacteria bacterium]